MEEARDRLDDDEKFYRLLGIAENTLNHWRRRRHVPSGKREALLQIVLTHPRQGERDRQSMTDMIEQVREVMLKELKGAAGRIERSSDNTRRIRKPSGKAAPD